MVEFFRLIIECQLILYILAFFALLRSLLLFKIEHLRKYNELRLMISIQLADLFQSTVVIITNVQALVGFNPSNQYFIILDVLITYSNYVSQVFVVIISYYAYETLFDLDYIKKQRNFSYLMFGGYFIPFMGTLIVFLSKNFIVTVIFELGLNFFGVCLSFFFYFRIQRKLQEFNLNHLQVREINCLFLFPLMSFLFILVPNILFVFFEAFYFTEEVFIFLSVVSMAYPLYGIFDSWAYHKNIDIMTLSQISQSQSLDSNKSTTSLLQSELIILVQD